MIHMLMPGLGMLLGGFLVFLLAACTASATSTPLTISPTSTPFPAGPEVSVFVISTDLAVGASRVIFGPSNAPPTVDNLLRLCVRR